MLVITYGPLYRPKLIAQKYDVTLENYNDEEAAEAMYELLKNTEDDVYVEDGKAYVPAIRYYAFTSIDYTLVYIPRSKGINIYIPKSKLKEFAGILEEYITAGGSLRDFIMAKLRDKKIPYLHPNVALYYDDYLYLYIGGIEVVLPR